MHKITSRSLLGSILLFGLLVSGGAQAGDDACPVGALDGSDPTTTLDLEFGPGTSDLTTCLSNREDIKIVMQLNKPCRDSYATHPTGVNGKPTGDVSRVVNSVGNCSGSRAYALGNLRNMIKDLEITNGSGA